MNQQRVSKHIRKRICFGRSARDQHQAVLIPSTSVFRLVPFAIKISRIHAPTFFLHTYPVTRAVNLMPMMEEGAFRRQGRMARHSADESMGQSSYCRRLPGTVSEEVDIAMATDH
eukprot:CCRYP_002888-RA/>CCRYP_002888-RA protein AED:0.48 eAED:0.48 QI:0/0.5/0/1/0/0/3/0/114